MNNLTIRLASIADAELIADMSRHSFYETFASQNTAADIEKFMQEQFTRESLVAEVGMDENIFLLAYMGQEPAGYVRLKKNSFEVGLEAKKPIEICRFYALPSMIGKGIGKAMMMYTIGLATEQKYDCVWLGVWEKNERAIQFYTAFGFAKFGEHGFWVGNDLQTDWLMKRLI